MKTIAVKFQSEKFGNGDFDSKDYHYYTIDEAIEVDDLVVVETRYGYKIAKVSEIDVISSKANSYVVQKIDTSAFLAEKKRIEKLEELEKKMEERYAQASKLDRYKEAAKSDTELADLLDQYHSMR